MVERLFYTQLVGGSNPSPCTKDFLFEQKVRTMKVRAFLLFFSGLVNENLLDDKIWRHMNSCFLMLVMDAIQGWSF